MATGFAAERQSLSMRYRWISLLEVVLGVFFVLGHNVFRLVPLR
jgi:hypothetical protein